MTATKSTSEVAAALGIDPNLVRQIARRHGIRAVGRDLRTGEALWPADKLLDFLPKRHWSRKAKD